MPKSIEITFKSLMNSDNQINQIDDRSSSGSTRSRIIGTHGLGIILLFFVCTFALSLNFYYLSVNTTPQHWDPSNHVIHSMRIARNVAAGDIHSFLRTWFKEYVYYPPGFYAATAPAFWIFGYSIKIGIAWQMLYLLLTLIAIHWLISKYSNPLWGALGATIYLCFPIVLGLSRMVYIENLLALQVILVIILAMPFRAFERRLPAFFLGVILGFGQMTKWQFVLYVAPLLFIILISRALKLRKCETKRKAWLQLFVCSLLILIISLMICAPWYLINFKALIRDLSYNAYIKVLGNDPLSSPKSIFYYVQAVPWQMIGIPISITLFLAVFSCLFIPRYSTKERFIWGLSLVLSIALLSFSTHKQGRFIMPLLPFCAIILMTTIASLHIIPRTVFLSVLVSFSTLNCFTQTIDWSSKMKEIYVPIGFGRNGYILRFGTPEWILPPVRIENWALDEIVEEIKVFTQKEQIEPTVHWVLKEDHHYYNPITLMSYVYANNLIPVNRHTQANFWLCRLDKFYEDGHIEAERQVYAIKTWELPDHSIVKLYRCFPIIPPLDIPLELNHLSSDVYFPGFYSAEKEHRWSRGNHASIEFILNDIAPDSDLYELTISCFGLGNQNINISLNGHEVGLLIVDGTPSKHNFQVKKEQLKLGGRNVLEFFIPGAKMPNTRDQRILGLGFIKLTLDKVTERVRSD